MRKKDKENKDSGQSKTIGTLLKEDFFRVIWAALYLFAIGFMAYVTYSMLPFLFSYMYTSIGALIGMDYANAGNADLLYWGMISLSVGAVAVAIISTVLYKFCAWISRKMVVKHVLRK